MREGFTVGQRKTEGRREFGFKRIKPNWQNTSIASTGVTRRIEKTKSVVKPNSHAFVLILRALAGSLDAGAYLHITPIPLACGIKLHGNLVPESPHFVPLNFFP